MSCIVAVNRSLRLVLFDNGEHGEMSTLIDSYGEDTDDPEEATLFVAELPDGTWTSELFSEYDEARVH